MSTSPQITSPSLAEAVGVAENMPGFEFQNQWLIDVDDRVKSFGYDDRTWISKRCSASKATKEMNNAANAQQLLAGERIGASSLAVCVPETIEYHGSHFVVSEYAGADMNDRYYCGEQPALSADAWASSLLMLIQKGVRHNNLLPRNVITTPNGMNIIDWESADFQNGPYPLDSLTWTGMAIGWSYIYGTDIVKEVQSDLSFDKTPPTRMTAYEKTFSDLLGFEGSLKILREFVCASAVAAEADRGHGRPAYKLDDSFHIIGEQLPLQIEVIQDMILARQSDAEHYASSVLIGDVAGALFREGRMGDKKQALDVFRRRCARLVLLLADTGLTGQIAAQQDRLKTIDSVHLPSQSHEVMDWIRTAICRSYPRARPQTDALKASAESIASLVG